MKALGPWTEIQTESKRSDSEWIIRDSDDDCGSFLTVYPLSPTSPGNPGAPVWPCRRTQDGSVSSDLFLPLLESRWKCNTEQKCHILPKYLWIQSLCEGNWSLSSYRHWTFCALLQENIHMYIRNMFIFLSKCYFNTFCPSCPWRPSLPFSPGDPWAENTETAESGIKERFKTNF